MNREIPIINRVLHKKEQERVTDLHLSRIMSMKVGFLRSSLVISAFLIGTNINLNQPIKSKMIIPNWLLLREEVKELRLCSMTIGFAPKTKICMDD